MSVNVSMSPVAVKVRLDKKPNDVEMKHVVDATRRRIHVVLEAEPMTIKPALVQPPDGTFIVELLFGVESVAPTVADIIGPQREGV